MWIGKYTIILQNQLSVPITKYIYEFKCVIKTVKLIDIYIFSMKIDKKILSIYKC